MILKKIKNINSALAVTVLLTMISVVNCTLQSPLDESYYQSGDNIVGGARPTAPVIEALDYPTQKMLKWSASLYTDPTTSVESAVANYNVYFYLNTIPDGLDKFDKVYYRWQTVSDTQLSLEGVVFFSGTNYIAVTGDNAGRESELSNTFSLVQ